MANITFETLRDRNNRDLEGAGYSADLPPHPDRAQEISRLLTERAALEISASTQRQRESYGVNRWHVEWVRMRDIRDAAVRSGVWRLIPQCKFKRFQETFCRPEDFIVPAFRTLSGGKPEFIKQHDFSTLSVAPCLVSPDRIGDKLAQQLGLVTFGEAHRRRDDLKLREKCGLEVCQTLKMIWDSAKTLGSLRFLIVSQPTEAIRAYYPDARPLRSDILGAILYSRGNGRAAGREQDGAREDNHDRGRAKIIQFFSTALRAHRKTLHQRSAQAGELIEISDYSAQVEAFVSVLDKGWRKGVSQSAKQSLETDARSLAQKGVERLRGKVNSHKVRARSYFERIDGVKDSRGRSNPSTTCSKMSTGRMWLQKRRTENTRIGSYNQEDESAFWVSIASHQAVLRTIRENLEAQAWMLTARNLCPFVPGLSPAKIEGTSRLLENSLRINPGLFDLLTVRPYSTTGSKLRECYDSFHSALLAQQKDRALVAYKQMHAVVVFSAVNSVVEQVRLMIHPSHNRNANGALELLWRLDERLLKRDGPLPSVMLPSDWRAQREAVEAKLLALTTGLKDYQASEARRAAFTEEKHSPGLMPERRLQIEVEMPKAEKDCVERYDGVQRELDDFDVEAVIRAL